MGEFWIKQPSELLSLNLLPSSDMTDEQRLNSLTRLILVITAILFVVYYGTQYWWKFLLCGLGIVFLLYFSLGSRDKGYLQYFTCEVPTFTLSDDIIPTETTQPTVPEPRKSMVKYVRMPRY
jgi:hypothetical protein